MGGSRSHVKGGLILGRRFKSPLVPKIIRLYEKLGTDHLKFIEITDHLGDGPSAIAGVLSSYPSVFAKAGQVREFDFHTGNSNKNTIWKLIPEEEVDDSQIMELYGFSDETMSELSDGENIKYKWISAVRGENGKFSRRDIQYIMHHMRKDRQKTSVGVSRVSTVQR
tara:strand:+ start:4623 stop:5123 length:501 start_codon:yes stop_codon:yes gene_type:complete